MIKVYVKNGCPQCRMTERFLNEHNKEFNTFNTSENADYRNEVIEMGYRSLPVVVLPSGERWNGFDIDKLKKFAV